MGFGEGLVNTGLSTIGADKIKDMNMESDPATTPGYEMHQTPQGEVGGDGIQELEHPHTSLLRKIGKHLEDVSNTNAFGDEHRAKSLAAADALETIMKEQDDKVEVQDPESNEQDLSPETEETNLNAGVMGEKGALMGAIEGGKQAIAAAKPIASKLGSAAVSTGK